MKPRTLILSVLLVGLALSIVAGGIMALVTHYARIDPPRDVQSLVAWRWIVAVPLVGLAAWTVDRI